MLTAYDPDDTLVVLEPSPRRTGEVVGKPTSMKIAVVGTGYVGLVVGACLAESGNDVICVDKDESKVRALKRGQIPIYEPGLEELVKRNKAEGRLTFTTEFPKAVKASQIVFIAVGTPQGEDGSADLQHVLGWRATWRAPWTATASSSTRARCRWARPNGSARSCGGRRRIPSAW